MTDDATATIREAAGGLHRLELAGAFLHPHWLAFLCGGLAGHGVSVVSGSAVRASPLHWDGQLLLDASSARGPVTDLDAVALAGLRPAVRDAASPRLTAYEVRRLPDRRLEVDVRAPDELGFLGRLLSRISLLTLLPAEVQISTVRGEVQDRLVLSGIGRGTPGDDVDEALRGLLAGLVT
ncbi:MAG: hypothetical protein ACXVGH_09665 [Mycobacteriales bacterium]